MSVSLRLTYKSSFQTPSKTLINDLQKRELLIYIADIYQMLPLKSILLN